MANELYRQAIHLSGGVLVAIAAFLLPQQLFLWLIGLCLLAWLVIILFFADHFTWLFSLFERSSASFTGKGALFFGLGCFATGLFFWEQAGWALLSLAIPDSLATIIGKIYRSISLPYNHHKTLLGTTTFFITCFIILSVHISFIAAALIAFLLAALESFDLPGIYRSWMTTWLFLW